jgi:hypothetical protein
VWRGREGVRFVLSFVSPFLIHADLIYGAEKFDNAIKEYMSALSILDKILAPSNRNLSELHMLIALAFDFIPDSVHLAVEYAEKSKAVLLLKLAELEAIDEGKRNEKDVKEIADIKDLMGDLDMKVRSLSPLPFPGRAQDQQETLADPHNHPRSKTLKSSPSKRPKPKRRRRLTSCSKADSQARLEVPS